MILGLKGDKPGQKRGDNGCDCCRKLSTCISCEAFLYTLYTFTLCICNICKAFTKVLSPAPAVVSGVAILILNLLPGVWGHTQMFGECEG